MPRQERPPTNEQARPSIEEDFLDAKKNIEGSNRAVETLAALQSARNFFELGVKLGKEAPGSQEAQELKREIMQYLVEREDQIAQQLYPSRRPK